MKWVKSREDAFSYLVIALVFGSFVYLAIRSEIKENRLRQTMTPEEFAKHERFMADEARLEKSDPRG